MRRSLQCLALVAAIAAIGCKDKTAPLRDPCLQGTEVTVDPRDPVRFSWEPCGMSVLYVRPESGGTVTWWIESDTNSIQSPIVYGVVPAGSTELTPSEPLVAGTDYRVTIVRRYGTRLNDLTAVGAQIFTLGLSVPPPAGVTSPGSAGPR